MTTQIKMNLNGTGEIKITPKKGKTLRTECRLIAGSYFYVIGKGVNPTFKKVIKEYSFSKFGLRPTYVSSL